MNAPITCDELEVYVRDAARAAGIDTHRPFPFVIEGGFRELDAHVVNGYCPMNEGSVAGTENQPFRCLGRSGSGEFIGIFAEDSAGQLTHHGSCLHMHALIESPPALVAHVERVAIESGATLRLPAR